MQKQISLRRKKSCFVVSNITHIIAVQSLQDLISQYYGNHICGKVYENQFVDFNKTPFNHKNIS